MTAVLSWPVQNFVAITCWVFGGEANEYGIEFELWLKNCWWLVKCASGSICCKILMPYECFNNKIWDFEPCGNVINRHCAEYFIESHNMETFETAEDKNFVIRSIHKKVRILFFHLVKWSKFICKHYFVTFTWDRPVKWIVSISLNWNIILFQYKALKFTGDIFSFIFLKGILFILIKSLCPMVQ